MKNTFKKVFAAVLGLICLVSFCACSLNDESASEDDSTTSESTAADTTVKEALPDFTVYTMNGEKVTLYESFGKPLVVNFWATWCPPCKAEMPSFDTLYKKYGDSIDFMMINLTDGQRDTREAVETFISENGYSFPVYCDSDMDAAYAYGVQSIPMTLFFSSEGELVNYHVGAISESKLEGILNQMMEMVK